MYNFSPYWTSQLKISFLQRVVLIHSYLYYEKDDPIWSDKKFDEIAKQLVVEQEGFSRTWIRRNTQYGYVFYDFDGTTGFDLWERLRRGDKTKIRWMAERRMI